MSIETICAACGEEYDMRGGDCPICSYLTKRLFGSDEASALTKEAARHIQDLQEQAKIHWKTRRRLLRDKEILQEALREAGGRIGKALSGPSFKR